jgi:hypothetical protein
VGEKEEEVVVAVEKEEEEEEEEEGKEDTYAYLGRHLPILHPSVPDPSSSTFAAETASGLQTST